MAAMVVLGRQLKIHMIAVAFRSFVVDAQVAGS
jgi:hypothetical protein